jgi:hypothetical protein
MQSESNHARRAVGTAHAKPNVVLAIHSWGKPVHRGSSAIGDVTVCDRGWGGFTTTGELIAVAHNEDVARRAVLARGPRECEQ